MSTRRRGGEGVVTIHSHPPTCAFVAPMNSNMDFTEKMKKGCKFMKGVILYTTVTLEKAWYGPVVKRSRHRPFTAVTRVRFPVGSPKALQQACRAFFFSQKAAAAKLWQKNEMKNRLPSLYKQNAPFPRQISGLTAAETEFSTNRGRNVENSPTHRGRERKRR